MSKTATPDVKELYAPTVTPAIVDVPDLNFLMIDGVGNPNTAAAFQDAIQALYSLSYGIHFALKKEGVESRVMPLEALFWVAGKKDFLNARPEEWRWTEMIAQPESVTPALFEKVRQEAQRKKPIGSLAKVRLERFAEGKAAQVMHIGPYSAEMPTIQRLHAFIAEQGYKLRGKHHEIYLGDPRRAAPEKLRTAIRQPVA